MGWFFVSRSGGIAFRSREFRYPQASVALSRVEPSAGFSSPRIEGPKLANARLVTLCDMLDSAARDAEDCGDLSDARRPTRGTARPGGGLQSVSAVHQTGGNHSRPSCRAIEAMRAALEVASVSFILEGRDGPGVRLRKRRTGPRTIAAEDLNASDG